MHSFNAFGCWLVGFFFFIRWNIFDSKVLLNSKLCIAITNIGRYGFHSLLLFLFSPDNIMCALIYQAWFSIPLFVVRFFFSILCYDLCVRIQTSTYQQWVNDKKRLGKQRKYPWNHIHRHPMAWRMRRRWGK